MKELNGIKFIERFPLIKREKVPLFILIHGYGSNEQDLFSFSSDLPQDAHIISLRALHNIEYGGYAWYDINFINGEKWMDDEQGIDSRNRIISFIELIKQQKKIEAEKVTLIGFSQGAILSYSVALNNPNLVKNIAILSGYPEEKIIGDFNHKADFTNLNFFISHGVEDAILPIELGRMGDNLLKSLDITHQYREYHSGHSITAQNYADLIDWVREIK